MSAPACSGRNGTWASPPRHRCPRRGRGHVLPGLQRPALCPIACQPADRALEPAHGQWRHLRQRRACRLRPSHWPSTHGSSGALHRHDRQVAPGPGHPSDGPGLRSLLRLPPDRKHRIWATIPPARCWTTARRSTIPATTDVLAAEAARILRAPALSRYFFMSPSPRHTIHCRRRRRSSRRAGHHSRLQGT